MNEDDEVEKLSEEEMRIYSKNIPIVKSMNKKEFFFNKRQMSPNVKQKYMSLMKEMKNFTGAPALLQWGVSTDFSSGYERYEQEKKTCDPLILFYGFNGMLAQKYSVIRDMGHDEIIARMQIAGDKVPYSIKEGVPFGIVINQMRDTPNALSEIPFDDALNIIRIGIQKLQVEEFVDADEDEFDDNCVEACKPGLHVCGK